MNEQEQVLEETETIETPELIEEELDTVETENFFKRNQKVLAGLGLAGAGFGGGFMTNFFLERRKRKRILGALRESIELAHQSLERQLNGETEPMNAFVLNNASDVHDFIITELIENNKMSEKEKQHFREVLARLVDLSNTVSARELEAKIVKEQK